MGKIVKQILSISFILISCDVQPHNINEVEFYFLNKTTSELHYKISYNGNESHYVPLEIDGKDYTSSGSILGTDSIVFIKVNTLDTLKFINESHGGDLSTYNNVYDIFNWVKKEHNNFYYTITDEDFK
ncbi:hypothetical protein [Marinigracilibium pacificum]|uniref:Lipoprotein n=1 Tax=Marinigracilibium pacificum TaxID=2729599 RepID=A0A848J8Q4_9BACT|nr:hypothetical protein [Marinigracilibium pacificum]NMM50759.1 hypothetical protein [Marinigracilibium pacificum]